MSDASTQHYLERLFCLDGRIALVTGGSRGIGWAIADGLARAGATVFATARSPNPDRALPASVTYVAGDLLQSGAINVIRDRTIGKSGRVDILVNAAGVTLPRSDVDAFDRTVALNLRAPYLWIRAVEPLMRTAAKGSIINVTSLGAFRGFPDNPAYVAAKGGLSQLTRAFAEDLGRHGIRVNNLVPGYINTALTAASHADPVRHEQRRRHTMLGRWGEAGDLVGAAIFLASDAASYVTGQDIVVDGGWLAKGLV
jgi:NAD(P)-dependent dehydrogenase (short-subunit alcohol dehydrogenase family)